MDQTLADTIVTIIKLNGGSMPFGILRDALKDTSDEKLFEVLLSMVVSGHIGTRGVATWRGEKGAFLSTYLSGTIRLKRSAPFYDFYYD